MRALAAAFLLLTTAITGTGAASPGPIPSPGSAFGPGVVSGPNFVVDGFNHVHLRPDARAYWWVANTGILDGEYNVYYDYCGDASCVLAKRDGFTTFARFELRPGGVPGAYYAAEIAEMQTGYSHGTEMKWGPSLRHPVVMSTRFRFSENYSADGSGGAVGSAGVWLWNSPIDFVNEEIHPYRAMGLSWVTNKSVLAPGLAVTVYQDSWATYVASPKADIDLTEWNTYLSIWRVDAEGTQSVAFWINGEFLGEAPIEGGFDPLSVEIWNDNQHVEWEGIAHQDVVESQHMDLDAFTVFIL